MSTVPFCDKGESFTKSLIPLYACLFTGCAAVAFFSVRTASKSPDVTWSSKKNPEPWQEYTYKRYQLLNPAKARGWTVLPRPKQIWD